MNPNKALCGLEGTILHRNNIWPTGLDIVNTWTAKRRWRERNTHRRCSRGKLTLFPCPYSSKIFDLVSNGIIICDVPSTSQQHKLRPSSCLAPITTILHSKSIRANLQVATKSRTACLSAQVILELIDRPVQVHSYKICSTWTPNKCHSMFRNWGVPKFQRDLLKLARKEKKKIWFMSKRVQARKHQKPRTPTS